MCVCVCERDVSGVDTVCATFHASLSLSLCCVVRVLVVICVHKLPTPFLVPRSFSLPSGLSAQLVFDVVRVTAVRTTEFLLDIMGVSSQLKVWRW